MQSNLSSSIVFWRLVFNVVFVLTWFMAGGVHAYTVTLTPMLALDDPCHDAFGPTSASMTKSGGYVAYKPYFFNANNVPCTQYPVADPFYQYNIDLQQGVRIAPTASKPFFSAIATAVQDTGGYTAISGYEKDALGNTIDSGIYLLENSTQLLTKLPISSAFNIGWDVGQNKIQFDRRLGSQYASAWADSEYDIATSTLTTTRRPLEPASLIDSVLATEDGATDYLQITGRIFRRDKVAGTVTEIDGQQVNGLSPVGAFPLSVSSQGSVLIWRADYLMPGAVEPVGYLFHTDFNTGSTIRIPGSENCPRDMSRPELRFGNFCGYRPRVSGNGRFVAFIQAASKVGSNPTNPPIFGTIHPRGLALYDRETNTTEMLVNKTCTAYWDDDSLPTFCARAGGVSDISYDGLSMILINGDVTAYNNPFYGTLPMLVEIAPAVAPTPQVSIIARPVSEGDSAPHIALGLSRRSVNPVTVTIESADVEATQVDDYVMVQQTVTINPGETYVAVPITLVDDQVVENSERFNVSITSINGASAPVDNATVIIRDDDSARTVSITDIVVNEWETELKPFEELPVTLSQASTEPVFVAFQFRDITTNSSVDYGSLTHTLRFEPGTTVGSLPFPLIDDLIVENTETLEVEIIGASAGTTIGNAVATVTINDNDTLPNGTPKVRVSNSFANEDNAPFDAEIALLLSPASAQPVTVTVETRSGTATAGDDFVATTQQATFLPGEDFLVLPVTILDDNLVEGTESFIVEITSASGAIVSDGIARFTIQDGNESPDRRSVEFSPVSLSNNVFTEASGTADVAIKLLGSADQVTDVSVRSYPISATEGVDYTGITQTVTFLPGDREALVSIPITQDQDVEPGETLGLQITNVTGGVVRDIDDSETLVIILDDDEVAATPSLSVDDVSVSEGDGTVQVPIRLLQASGQPVSVSVFTRNVDAVGGQDFYGFTQSVTIPAGATTASVSLTLLDDALPENTETLELRLFNPQGAVLADAVGVITITDNDVITTPDLSIDDVNVSEGDGTVQVPISLSQASAQPVTFSVFTRSGSAVGGQDFYGFTKSVSIPAGATTGLVSLTLLDDSLPESTEAMELRVFAVQGANVVDNVAVVSITDNDQPTMPDMTIDDASVSESDGTVQVLVRLSQPSAQAVNAMVFTRSVSAQGGQDFYGFTRNVTIPPGATSTTVSLTIVNDAIAEPTETMQLRMFNATGATLVDNIGVVTITDDD